MANTQLKEPEIGSTEWTQNWLIARKEKRMKIAKEMSDLGKFFENLGFKFLRVCYQGSGDEGEAFTCEGWKDDSWKDLKYGSGDYEEQAYDTWKDGKRIAPKDEWQGTTRNQKTLHKEYAKWRKEHPDTRLIDDINYILVDLIDYDWYNNEGGQGQVIWDLKAGEIFVDGEQNVNACNSLTEKYFVDGRQPKMTYDDRLNHSS